MLVDAHGDGMLFVNDPRQVGMGALLHHKLSVPLVSHWSESLRILFKRMEQTILFEAFRSPTWLKGVFTKTHRAEMDWLGIPGCFHSPLAAYDFPSEPSTPRVASGGPTVVFAGSQQSLYFAHDDGVDPRTQWHGGVALSAVADGSSDSFLDVYRRFGFEREFPSDDDTPACRADRAKAYYDSKLFFTAMRNLGTRDRFILFLCKTLGRRFRLIGGDRWKDINGLPARPPVDNQEYIRLIRETPVSLAVVNGDNDSGLNLRHFEITARGGFLLSYHQPELDELFEVGKECESFTNEPELLEKITYYVEHPDERNRIARAGQARTLREHLLHHRLEGMIAQVRRQGLL